MQAMTQWAFQQKDIVFVDAETELENKVSQCGSEKCGCVPDRTTGEGGSRFVPERLLL